MTSGQLLEKLVVSHLSPVAKGSSRWVFECPNEPDLLIKVLKIKLPEHRSRNIREWWAAAKGRYKLARHLRELKEYIGVVSRSHDELALHLPAMQRMMPTDLGFGIAVQAVRDDEERLAPTLKQLLKKQQLTDEMRTALDLFFQRLIASDVVIGDLHAGNLVYGKTSLDSQKKFYMVDGLGDSTLIPSRSFFPFLNQDRKKKSIAKLRRRAGC